MAKERNIQQFLKPQRGRVRQGYFTPQNPDKYKGDSSAVIYRSSWELKFLQYCDNNDKVLEYAAEPLGIPYANPLNNRTSMYWIDCYMKTLNTDGSNTEWLIEVKPNKFLTPPAEPKRLTEKQVRAFAKHAKAYAVNSAKFAAARVYAAQHKMKFGIITENFLFNKV